MAASTRVLATETKNLADYTYALVVVGAIVGAFNLLVLAFQVFILCRQLRYTRLSAIAAKASSDWMKNAERAYVGLRHWSAAERQDGRHMGFHSPTGEGRDPKTGLTKYKLEIRVVNTGHTPATILGGTVERVANLKEASGFSPRTYKAAPDDERIYGTFLQANAHYMEKLFYRLDDTEVATVKAEGMWLVGSVVYIDELTQTMRRSGYCRHVNLTNPGKNNLEIDETSLPYNYDCELNEHGECKKRQQESDKGRARLG